MTCFPKRLIALLVVCFCAAPAAAQIKTSIHLSKTAGIAPYELIEKNASDFITALSMAFFEGEVPDVAATTTAQGRQSIMQLWNNGSKLYCAHPSISRDLIRSGQGYQIRNIPLFLDWKDADGNRSEQKFVLILDEAGQIDGIDFALELHDYKELIKLSDEVTTSRRKNIMMGFLQNFRTAYNRKDLSFLHKVYSDSALIIVGRVIEVEERTDAAEKVIKTQYAEMIKRSKSEYLANLEKAFAANEFINVEFYDVTIVQHPQYESIYGINLFQHWTSTSYSDAGFLFLMIDFAGEDNPLIHVRAWQPELSTTPEDAIQLNTFRINMDSPN